MLLYEGYLQGMVASVLVLTVYGIDGVHTNNIKTLLLATARITNTSCRDCTPCVARLVIFSRVASFFSLILLP